MTNNKCIYTNEFICKPNYTNIEADFDIFVISLMTEDCASEEDRKKYVGSHILDIVDFSYNALSVLYRYGNRMFCLYQKNEVTEDMLKNKIEEKLCLKVQVKKVEPTNASKDGIYTSELVQLLSNSLMNDIDERYNNLGGRLYFIKSDSVIRDKKNNAIKSIVVFEFEFMKYMKSRNSSSEDKKMSIQVKTVTFNSVDRLLYYYKSKDKLEKIHSSPKYIFDDSGNFRRCLKGEEADKSHLFASVKLGKKHNQSFLKFDSINEFRSSKMGVLHQFLTDIESYLSSYLSVEPVIIRETKIINKMSDNLIYRSEKDYFKKVNERGIVIVNKITDDQRTDIFIEEIKHQFNKCGISNIVQVPNIMEDRYNIIVIHDEDYYADRDLKDEHQAVVHGQHIVLDNYFDEKTGALKIQSATIRKIIYEFLVKEDIKNNCISLYRMEGLNKMVQYAVPKSYRDKDEKKRRYHILMLEPDGQMNYYTADEKTNADIFTRLEKYSKSFKEKYVRITDLEAIVFNDEEAIGIIHNDIYTIPALSEIYNILNLYSKDKSIDSAELKKYLLDFLDEYPQHKDLTENAIVKIDSSQKKSYTYEEITNGYRKEKGVPALFTIKSKMATDFITFCRINYGIVINPLLKNAEYEDVIRTGTTNINIYRNAVNPLDRRIFYFVGFKGSINKYKIEKAVHIRSFEPFTRKNTLMDLLQTQLNIDFVRLGEYTVYPFPIKYLNEYIILHKENI